MNMILENNLKKIERALNYAYNVRGINALGKRTLEDWTQLFENDVQEAIDYGLKKGLLMLYKGNGGSYRLNYNPITEKNKRPTKKERFDQMFLNNIKANKS